MYAAVLHIERLLCYRRCIFPVLELNARYEWRVTPPYTHRNLFVTSHLCVLKHIILITTGPIRTFCISNDSCTIRKHSLCGLELHERFDWRGTALATHRSFSDTTLCACTYCKPVYISLFGTQRRLTTKLTHLMIAYCTHQTTALLPTMHRFIRT